MSKLSFYFNETETNFPATFLTNEQRNFSLLSTDFACKSWPSIYRLKCATLWNYVCYSFSFRHSMKGIRGKIERKNEHKKNKGAFSKCIQCINENQNQREKGRLTETSRSSYFSIENLFNMAWAQSVPLYPFSRNNIIPCVFRAVFLYYFFWNCWFQINMDAMCSIHFIAMCLKFDNFIQSLSLRITFKHFIFSHLSNGFSFLSQKYSIFVRYFFVSFVALQFFFFRKDCVTRSETYAAGLFMTTWRGFSYARVHTHRHNLQLLVHFRNQNSCTE